MSIKIGIVSEGASDYWALKHIVERYLKELDVYTIALKPKITSKGKQDGFGTWQGVFNYIAGTDDQKLIVEAVNEGCQFVIIQIDTDVSAEYGVPKNADLSAYLNEVKAKLSSSVHPEFDQSKLIYAICVEELECWLIPFLCTDSSKCTNTDRCLNIVNREIRTEGAIDKDNKNCDAAQRLYSFILNKKKKPKEIQECAQHNLGFQTFIEQLDSISHFPQ